MFDYSRYNKVHKPQVLVPVVSAVTDNSLVLKLKDQLAATEDLLDQAVIDN